MERSPATYSRILIFGVLLPLLVVDVVVGLPERSVLVAGAVVFAVVAGLHGYGREYHAAAGWVAFGAALALVALRDVTEEPLALVGFGAALLVGLALLVSGRLADRGS